MLLADLLFNSFFQILWDDCAINSLMKKEINAYTKIQSDYQANATNVDYDAKVAEYASHYKRAKDYGLYRNISYGAAAVLTVGFVVTWAF
jgi:hypothetical protein